MFVHVKETYVLPFKRIFVKDLVCMGRGWVEVYYNGTFWIQVDLYTALCG